jgi:hypothetical protein
LRQSGSKYSFESKKCDKTTCFNLSATWQVTPPLWSLDWSLASLREAGLLMHDVDAGFPRALLAMFVVAEVHPFNDGNGRLARLVISAQCQ